MRSFSGIGRVAAMGAVVDDAKRVPCLVQQPSLYDGKRFPIPQRGRAPLRIPPRGAEGPTQAADPNPAD